VENKRFKIRNEKRRGISSRKEEEEEEMNLNMFEKSTSHAQASVPWSCLTVEDGQKHYLQRICFWLFTRCKECRY
jgi:hypothetical protein